MKGHIYPEKEIAEEGGQDLGVNTILSRVGENLSQKCWKKYFKELSSQIDKDFSGEFLDNIL